MNRAAETPGSSRLLPWLIAALIAFAVLANGAHDVWAATVVYVAALGFAAALVIRAAWRQPSAGIFVDGAAAAAAVAAVFAVSFKFSINPSDSFLAWCDWCAAALLVLVALNAFRSDASLDVLLPAAIAIFAIELAANIQHQSLPGTIEVSPGTMVNANVEAGFVLLWMPLAFARVAAAWADGRRIDKEGAAALVLGAIDLGFTRSASAGLCALAALVCFWERGARPQSRGARAAILAAAAAAGGWFLWGRFARTHPFIAHGGLAGGSSFSRLDWWRSGFLMWTDHPWFGVGLGNYSSAYLAYKVGAVEHTLFAHSLFVELLAETGVAGTAVALTVLALAVHRGYAGAPARRPLVTGAVLFLIYASVNIGAEYLVNLLLAAVFLGAALAPSARVLWRPRRLHAIVAVAALALSLPYVIAPFFASRQVASGEIFTREGDWDAAARNYEAAAAIDSLSWEAERGRAAVAHHRFLVARAPADLQDALRHARRALSLNRLSGLLSWELGTYELEAGDRAAARACFESAVKLHSTNKIFRESLESLTAAR